MDASVVAAIIAGVGVIMSAWLGFAGNKKGTLATAERDFRETILEENKDMRVRMEEMEKTISAVMLENRQLKMEIIQLRSERRNAGGEDGED